MIRILFVCHGNICRSPMAEFVLKDMLRKAGRERDFEVASAAFSGEELGNDVYPPARREMEKHGIPWEHRAARVVTRADLARFDRIYYMDSRNAGYIRRMFPGDGAKFQPLLARDVADPYYTGDFTQTWQDIWEGCSAIMEELL